MRLIGTAFVAAMLVSGCGAGGANEAAPPAAAANGATASADISTEVNAAWLAGRWQAGETGSCGPGDAFFVLEPGGRYALSEEQGRWSLEGNRLQIEVTHESSDSGTAAGQRNMIEVRRLGPDTAEFVAQGRPPIRVTRCRG